jgi:LysM domain
MTMIPPAVSAPIPTNHGGQSVNRSSDVQTTSNPSAPSSAGGGTKVFGNLQGRDPDLVFAGEKIMINGKSVTIGDGETLSSLAAKNGTTVDKLISENKMDSSLLGKNAQGQYFTPGGPQPANGGALTPAPNTTPQKFEPPAPAGPNGTYTKEQATTTALQVQQLQAGGKVTKEVATETLDLLNTVISDPTKVTPEQTARLTALLKETSTQAAAASTPTNGNPATTPVPTSPVSTPPANTPTEVVPASTAPQTPPTGTGLNGADLLPQQPQSTVIA